MSDDASNSPPRDRLVPRCWWCGADPAYAAYHDDEWGRPQADDVRLFEKLCLEGFQSGLSWLTILRKRAAFRAAFDDFDIERVARFDAARIEALLADPGIVRHRAKIEAAIANARCARMIRDQHGSLAAYLWRFEPEPSNRPSRFDRMTLGALTSTPESTLLAQDLRRRGWRFIGPTTAYAFMQAMGLVNDHVEDCHVRVAVESERAAFVRPRANPRP